MSKWRGFFCPTSLPHSTRQYFDTTTKENGGTHINRSSGFTPSHRTRKSPRYLCSSGQLLSPLRRNRPHLRLRCRDEKRSAPASTPHILLGTHIQNRGSKTKENFSPRSQASGSSSWAINVPTTFCPHRPFPRKL